MHQNQNPTEAYKAAILRQLLQAKGATGGAMPSAAAMAQLRQKLKGRKAPVSPETARSAVFLAHRMLAQSRAGNHKARHAIACLNRKAAAGDPDAIRGRRILLACASSLGKKIRARKAQAAGGPFYDISGRVPANELPFGAGSPVVSISGQVPANELPYGAGFYSIAGQGQPPMSLHNYYTISGHHVPPEALYAGAKPVAAAAHQQHTHQVHLPDYHCTPGVNPVPTTAAGAYYGDGQGIGLVVGSDGKEYHQSWNGTRWIWSELQPHLGIRGEQQGFGLRDALLLGMRSVQQREVAAA